MKMQQGAILVSVLFVLLGERCSHAFAPAAFAGKSLPTRLSLLSQRNILNQPRLPQCSKSKIARNPTISASMVNLNHEAKIGKSIPGNWKVGCFARIPLALIRCSKFTVSSPSLNEDLSLKDTISVPRIEIFL
jgi:hypothetical protein